MGRSPVTPEQLSPKEVELNYSLLIDAGIGNIDGIREKIIAGADVRFCDRTDRNALFYALRGGHLDTAAFLLARGLDPNTPDCEGSTPLHDAATNKDEATVDFLLALKVELDVQDKGMRTAAAIAISSPPILKKLLDAGADPDIGTPGGYTPLVGAIVFKKHESIDLLLEHSAAIDPVDADGVTSALIEAVPSPGILARLLQENPDVDATIKNGTTALIKAVQASWLPAIELLVAAGADIDLADDKGLTPLHHAILQGASEAAKTLVALGADLYKPDAGGRTPHDWAMNGASPSITEYFDRKIVDDDVKAVTQGARAGVKLRTLPASFGKGPAS